MNSTATYIPSTQLDTRQTNMSTLTCQVVSVANMLTCLGVMSNITAYKMLLMNIGLDLLIMFKYSNIHKQLEVLAVSEAFA